MKIYGVITSFNRPGLFKLSLESLLMQEEVYGVIAVYHIDSEKGDQNQLVVNELSAKYSDRLVAIAVSGSNRSPIENMNLNRYIAVEYAFNKRGATHVLAIEDDIELDKNASLFCKEIFKKCSDDKMFMSINLGSRVTSWQGSSQFAYKRVCYGLSGQGSCMPKKTWVKAKKLGLLSNLGVVGMDRLLEPLLRIGYTVVPIGSMYIDHGIAGTHSPKLGTDPYYIELKESYQARLSKASFSVFEDRETSYIWREDCIPYRMPNHLLRIPVEVADILRVIICNRFNLWGISKRGRITLQRLMR